MRCRICGAKLKKEGDICTNCYKKYQEEEDLKKDVNERLVVKRKYSIAYLILKYTWLIIIFAFSTFGCFAFGNVLEGFGCIFILLIVLGILLFLDKRISLATKAVFYDKKIVYTFKFLFFDTEKTVKYSDLADITYFQTFSQKRFGYGDLCVYAKGAIPGTTIFNGFQLKNVENVDEVLNQIGEVVGKIEN